MRSTDSTDSDEDDLAAQFAAVIADLADGGLMFPAPFDLATSAALAANVDKGSVAAKLFAVTAMRETGYRVAIYATAPGVADRQVLDTTVDSTPMLLTVLELLIEEQCARVQEKETHGGQADHHPTDG